MKQLTLFFFCLLASCSLLGQQKVESFPSLDNIIEADFAQSDNIFPIAVVNVNLDGESFKIPISYSLLHGDVDTNLFLVKGDNIDHYSFTLLEDGKAKPMFKKEVLALPDSWLPYLTKAKQKFESAKSQIDLNKYIKFYRRPNWWQYDETPLCSDGTLMKFICQVELYDITADFCCLYIFFDKQNKLVKQVYQRT